MRHPDVCPVQSSHKADVPWGGWELGSHLSKLYHNPEGREKRKRRSTLVCKVSGEGTSLKAGTVSATEHQPSVLLNMLPTLTATGSLGRWEYSFCQG